MVDEPDYRIAALAHDSDVNPLWPNILAGKLEGSPGQVAAFAEACSTHGLDELEVGGIVARLRDHGRPPGPPLEVEVGDATAVVWAGHGLNFDDLSVWGQSYGIDSEPLEVWMLVDNNVGGFDLFYHRVAEGTPGAEPYTLLSREPWEIDDDVEASRAAMREDGA